MKKAPLWDLVGLALTLDKRLLIVLPVLIAIGFIGSKLF